MTSTTEAREMHLNDSACADLVLGLLDGAAQQVALSHARECPDCESRLRAHAGGAERASADWQSTVASTPMPLRTAPSKRALPLPALFAAAAVLMAAAALPLLLRTPPRGDDAATWLPAPGETVRTRGEHAPDSHLQAGLAAYEARDLVTAKRELEAARTEGSAEALRQLYLGHVLVANGQTQEGAELMGHVRWILVPEPWRREGAIAYARALRAVGDFARADSVERSLELRPNDKP